MEAAACAQPASAGPVYSRRQPEKTALYRVMQEYLLTFEQQWTDQASGRTLPKFVTAELHGFMSCGILGRGFAHLYCKTCREHYAVAFSCKARAVCPSCLGRRMNEGALNLVDHVLPDVPLRQFVLTMPFPLRFPLAFDGKLLKKPWSDGTACVDLAPLALIARLAALVPPPRKHVVRYFGVLSSHATSRSDVVPEPTEPAPAPTEQDKPKNTSRYISWSELLRRTFGIEILCTKCKSQLRLIALIKTEDLAKKILTAMHLPVDIPQLRPARPPPHKAGGGDDWLN